MGGGGVTHSLLTGPFEGVSSEANCICPGWALMCLPHGPRALGSRDNTLFTQYPSWLLEETQTS